MRAVKRSTDPIVLALAAAIAEIMARRAAEAAEGRAKLAVLSGGKKRSDAA